MVLGKVRGLAGLLRHLPAGAADRKYAVCCKRDHNCARCCFALRKHAWQTSCPLAANDPSRGSWLHSRGDGKNWSVFCSACNVCLQSDGVSLFRKSRLIKHGKSARHKRAVAKALGLDSDPGPGAPPRKHFHEVLVALQSGASHAGREGIAHIGKAKKIRKIVWCLAEAKRLFHLEKLRTSTTVALHQDGRKGFLAVRFACCGADDLRVTRGVLGIANLAQSFDLSASGMQKATIAVLQAACTPLQRPPFIDTASHVEQLDEDTLVHCCSCVELFNADAASDEQLAGKLLRGATETQSQQFTGIFSNLIVLNKDKPHASRRTCTRTWDKDPFLKHVSHKFVLGKKSMCRRIQHSEIFRAKFQNAVKNQRVNPTATRYIKSLSFVKPRFDSLSKPFSRGVLFFEAFLATTQEMSDSRKDKEEGKDANEFLATVTAEECITFGQLADAGEESIVLTRFMDDEDFDKSTLSGELQTYLDRIRALFVERGCYNATTTFTRHMLTFLAKRRSLFLHGGAVRFLGGPDDLTSAVLDRCVQRMVNWVHLATAVVRSEFPNFELLQSFEVFSLQSKNDSRTASTAVRSHLCRLAEAFQLCPDALSVQFEDIMPIARRRFQQRECSAYEAWKLAIHETQSDAKKRARHPAHELTQVLCRYGAWGGSTSGVERLFATSSKAVGLFRSALSDGLLNDEAILLCDAREPKLDKLCQRARIIWSGIYGEARTADRGERLDAGTKRTITGKPKLSGWLRQRRASVDGFMSKTGVQAAASCDSQTRVVGQDGWTEAHEKEAEFQRTNRQKRFLEGMDEGTLLDS